MQALLDGHSESETHPMGTIGGVALHVPLPLLALPLGQTHTIVSAGELGTTLHSAGAVQGSKVVHGLRQISLKQANVDG